MSKGAGLTFLMIILGGILGGHVAELLGLLVPKELFHDSLMKDLTLVFDSSLILNLQITILTFGMKKFHQPFRSYWHDRRTLLFQVIL